MKKTVIAIAASLIIMPTIVTASNSHHADNWVQFDGPVELKSVHALLSESSRFSDEDVILEGHFLRQTKKDTYVFSDGEGEINVELDDDISLNAPISADTKLRIFGEFEGGKTREIEVEHIQIL